MLLVQIHRTIMIREMGEIHALPLFNQYIYGAVSMEFIAAGPMVGIIHPLLIAVLILTPLQPYGRDKTTFHRNGVSYQDRLFNAQTCIDVKRS